MGTNPNTQKTIQNFEELTLPPELQATLKGMKFTQPTPIQSKAIPAALTGQDIIGCAQTGTGKTAAFSIPLITHLLANPTKSALILVPTRELAVQVEDVLKKLTHGLKDLGTALLIGGLSMHAQKRMLVKRPRILVATPGRLVDHLQQRSVNLSQVAILVLDEADRMLDMGFAPQLNQILRFVPKERQTLLFSATLPPDIEKMAGKVLKNPLRITIGQVSQAAPKILQEVVQTTQRTKPDDLVDELNARKGSILVFARTKRRTDKVARYLNQYGFNAGRIHGDRSQKQRQEAIDGFRSGKMRILVATDIAARGIDITHIAHVINYDLPQQAEDYVHRIGRTARAGAEGSAVTFVTPEDRAAWRDITKLLARAR